MSKPSRRPNREEIKRLKKEKKKAERKLREQQIAEGLEPQSHTTTANRKSEYETVEE